MIKRFIYYSLFALGLCSCNPMADVYDKLDKSKTDYNGSLNVTLESADYSTISALAKNVATSSQDSVNANLVKSNKAFSLALPASNYIPLFLENTYLAYGKGSSALVSYAFNRGIPAYLANNTLTYTLDVTDYTSVSSLLTNYASFSPSYSAGDYISGILSNKLLTAANNAIVFVNYRVSDIDPVVNQNNTIFSEGFNSGFGSFTPVSVVGNQVWTTGTSSTLTYAKMSGYSGGNLDNTDFLISPQIDLTTYHSVSLKVSQAAKYVSGAWENLKVVVSDDYNGSDVSIATWTPLTISTMPTGSDYNFVESEAVSLSAYAGKKIYVALKYVSTSSSAATWEVDQISVISNDVPSPVYTKYAQFYQLNNGSWNLLSEGVARNGQYIVAENDYNAMGETAGPGKTDSFSSTYIPENYLPQLLAMKLPYAKVSDTLDVIYKYGSASVVPKCDKYAFDGTLWSKYADIVNVSEQYVHNGSKWVFDPTITFTMTSADYQLIVNHVKSNVENGSSYVDSYGTGEFYSGASSFYSNFDLRLTKRTSFAEFSSLSEADAIALTYSRMKDAVQAMLKLKFPSAKAQVNGVEVFYHVTVNTYENDLSKRSMTYTFQCTSDVPEFTFVEGPTVVL